MSESGAPDLLRRVIAADLHPVRPLPGPWQRTLIVVPVSLALVFGVPLMLGYRQDLPTLGFALSWGLSFLQLPVGIFLILSALRETIPGQGRPWLVLSAWLVGAEALFFAVTLLTYFASPRFAASRLVVYFGVFCFTASLVAGIPVLVLSTFLARRALVTRPLLTGALYGMGSGLVGDAGYRIFCDVSDPRHVFLAHGAAVVVLTILGAVSARIVATRAFSKAIRGNEKGLR